MTDFGPPAPYAGQQQVGQQYGQYGQQYGQYGALPYGGYAPPTNTLAIIALVASFVMPIAGIICGHIALAQIRRTGESGRSLALAGTVIGYAVTGLIVVFVVAYIVFFVAIFGIVGASGGFS